MFDLLFFPLALINLWFVWLARQLTAQLEGARLVLVAMFVVGGLAMNAVLIRMATQWAQAFVRPPAPPVREPTPGTWPQAIRMTAWRLLLVTAMHLLLFETIQQLSVTWKESTGELWHMGLAVATLGGVIWATWPGYRCRRSWLFWGGGTVVSACAMHALVYAYSWHLRPNLGLYRESEWVSQHPGFQETLRERIEGNRWGAAGGNEPTEAHPISQPPFIGRLAQGSDGLGSFGQHRHHLRRPVPRPGHPTPSRIPLPGAVVPMGRIQKRLLERGARNPSGCGGCTVKRRQRVHPRPPSPGGSPLGTVSIA